MQLPTLIAVVSLVTVAHGSPIESRQDDSTTSRTTGTSFDASSLPHFLQSDILAGYAAINQQIFQVKNSKTSANCNASNTAVRKEWDVPELDYIKAVQCLGEKAPKTPSAAAPGVRNRYDDFVATHINQTFAIHGTGNFIGWHRYFTWAYEQTLRNECGYKGYQPYYNWAKWADDPESSPALDGSDTSMSGNGVLGCTNQTSYGVPSNMAPLISIPHGTGGGCIESGPFKDWKMNLGPVINDLSCTPPNPNSNFNDPLLGLGYNPRCIKRDISPWTTRRWSTDEQVMALLKSNDIYTFWANMQGGVPAFENNFLGVHTAGHFTVGGDPGGDFFSSPGDPYFFLHHAMIDRTWWTWQNIAPETRTNAIAGPISISNNPPSRNATLADGMNLGYAFDLRITLGDAMSTMDGPFCYTYL